MIKITKWIGVKLQPIIKKFNALAYSTYNDSKKYLFWRFYYFFLVHNNSKLVNKTKCIIKLIQVQFNSILKPNQSHFLKLY